MAVPLPQQLPKLPHAPPMHWLDTAELSTDGRVLTATRLITTAHLFVHDGHLLRSALIELMAQAAAAGALIKGERGGKIIRRGVLAAVPHLRVFAPAPVGEKIVIVAVEEKSFGPFTSAHISAIAGAIKCGSILRDEERSPAQGPGLNGQILLAEARMTFHLAFE